MVVPEHILAGGVNVRSYNVGFGDCFLVTFLDGDVTRNMLIDFGCAPGQSSVAFGPIIENILKETNGHLDVVVVTHEHADHMNGFLDQREALKEFQIDYVWMGLPSKPGFCKGETNLIDKIRNLSNSFKSKTRLEKTKIAQSFKTLILNNLGTKEQIDTVRNLPSTKKNVLYLKRGDSVGGKPFSRTVSVKVLAPQADISCYNEGNDDPDQYDLIQDLDTISKRLEAKLSDEKAHSCNHPLFPDKEYKNIRCLESPPNLSKRDWRTLREKNRGFGVPEIRALDAAINNTSLVLMLTINGKKLLFTGDAEWGSWYWMRFCDACIDSADVVTNCPGCEKRIKEFQSLNFLKLSQHGSRSGTPMDIFDGLKPSAKIMVSSKANVYGTKNKIPDADLMKKLRLKHGDNLISTDPNEGPLWVDARL